MTTRSTPSSRPRKPRRSRTRRAPSTSSAPSAASAAPSPPAAPAPGELAKGRERPPFQETPLQLGRLLGRGAFLGGEDPSRVDEGRAHVAGGPNRHAETAEHLHEPGAAVHGRRATEEDDDLGRIGVLHLGEELAEASARRPQRISLALRDQAQPDRLRGFDERRAVMEQPARHDRPPERIRDLCLAPLAAERRREHVERPLAAVGDRKLDSRLRSPSARAAAASRAERTPLRLAGHASAFTRRRRPELLDD